MESRWWPGRPVVCAVLALVLASAIVPGRGAAQETLRVGVLPFSESLGAVIADKQGFFKAEGLNVELQKIPTASQAMPLLQGGRIDIIFSNTVSTLQVIEQGMDLMMLAPGAVVRPAPPDTTAALTVLKGTAKTPKDLEGKRIAVNVVNSTAWMYLLALLDQNGLDRSKVRLVEVPFPQMNDPLLNGQVDAIVQVEPFRTVLQGTGKVDVIGWIYVQTQPNADITQYIALTPWVQKNQKSVAAFARAIVKGAEFANANEAATREINQQFTNLNPALKDKVLLPRFATRIQPDEIKKTMDLMLKYGLLKQPVDFSRRVLQ